MAEWLKATDCKSVLSRVRRFESFSAHVFNNVKISECENVKIFTFNSFHIFTLISGSSSVGRATAFQAVGRGFEPRLPLFLIKRLAPVVIGVIY